MQVLSDGWLKTWLVRLGIDRLVRHIMGGTGVILVLHRVRDPGDDLLFAANRDNMIGRDRLAALIEDLLSQDVPIVSLDEALDRGKTRRRERFVCLTFDDGYVDNYEALLPLVERLRVPIAIYVTPGLLDGTAPLWWYGLDIAIAHHTQIKLPLATEEKLSTITPGEKDRAFARCLAFMLRADPGGRAAVIDVLADRYGLAWPALASKHMMTWAQLRAMARSPLVTIGAHTVTHPVLARLNIAEAEAEIAASRSILSRELEKPVVHFAYPFGTIEACGSREAALVAGAGFRSAVTTLPGNVPGPNRRHLFFLPRHGLSQQDGHASLALKRAGFRRGLAPARLVC